MKEVALTPLHTANQQFIDPGTSPARAGSNMHLSSFALLCDPLKAAHISIQALAGVSGVDEMALAPLRYLLVHSSCISSILSASRQGQVAPAYPSDFLKPVYIKCHGKTQTRAGSVRRPTWRQCTVTT